MTPCSLVESYLHFVGGYCLHHQGARDTIFFRTVGKCLAGYTASRPRRLWYLSYVLSISSCNCPYKALTDWFLGAFAKLWETTTSFVMSVCPSVRPHGTTRLPLDGFSWNSLHEYFFLIYPKNSSYVKTWQEQPVIYVNISQLFDHISLISS